MRKTSSHTSTTLNPVYGLVTRVDGVVVEVEPLDRKPLAVAWHSDGSVEVGSNHAENMVRFIEEMRKMGVEVQLEGVDYGLPWCG